MDVTSSIVLQRLEAVSVSVTFVDSEKIYVFMKILALEKI